MLTRERSAPANLTLTIVAHKEPQATGSERTLRIVRERAGMGGIVYGGSRAYRTVILVLWACSPSTRTIYLSMFTMILLVVHPSLLYQCLCISLPASLIGSLLGLGNPNDRAPLVTF